MPQEPRPRQISGNRLTPASCSDDVGAGNQQLTPHVHTGVFHYPHVSRVCSNQSRGSLRSQATHFQSCHNEAAQTTLPCGRTAWTRSRALANQRQACKGPALRRFRLRAPSVLGRAPLYAQSAACVSARRQLHRSDTQSLAAPHSLSSR